MIWNRAVGWSRSSRRGSIAVGLLLLAGLARAETTPVEATSLLGIPLHRPTLPEAVVERRQAQLMEARREMLSTPGDPDALIWYGRRLAYLGRYRQALEVFGQGIETFPDDARFLRHRGHRWITVREFERAVADLSAAAAMVEGSQDQTEPDGLPNAFGIPTSTLHGNIWYHLALAHSLLGDRLRALPAWRECLALAQNDDSRVAATYWLYLTLRQIGLESEARELLARIDEDMEVIENHSYHRLLLVFQQGIGPRSELDAASHLDGEEADPGLRNATEAYGLATFRGLEGDAVAAADGLREIVRGSSWAAFGFLAAEAELARSQQPKTMAVTVDDVPFVQIGVAVEEQQALTDSLLSAFEAAEIPAVGFANTIKLAPAGELEPERVEVLETWLERGFELANHTASHLDLHQSSAAEFLADIAAGEDPLRALVEKDGGRLRYFRHPYLHTGLDLETRDLIARRLQQDGYQIAPVTLDPGEWIYASAYERTSDPEAREKIGRDYLDYMEAVAVYYDQQSRQVFGRAIPQVLLIHANRLNGEWFSRLIPRLREQQFSFVPLDRALEDPAFESVDTYAGEGGISWIHRWMLSAEVRGEAFGSEPKVPDWIRQLAGLD